MKRRTWDIGDVAESTGMNHTAEAFSGAAERGGAGPLLLLLLFFLLLLLFFLLPTLPVFLTTAARNANRTDGGKI